MDKDNYVITEDLFFVNITQIDGLGGFLIPKGKITIEEVRELFRSLNSGNE